MSSSSKFRVSQLRNAILAICSATAAVALCAPANAASVTINDGNTVAQIDEASGSVTSLTVDGIKQLANQSIFYSIDGGTPSFNPEVPSIVFLNYNGPDFTALLGYQLTGGASASQPGSLSTSVLINALPPQGLTPLSSLSVSVYQYDHLTLDNGTNSTLQVNPGADQVTQTEIGGRGATASVTPLGNEYQVGVTPSVFNSLSAPVTLNDSAGPVSGDVEFALESDTPNLTDLSPITVLSLESFNAGVPVPAAAWMGLTTLAGIGAIAAARRKLARA